METLDNDSEYIARLNEIVSEAVKEQQLISERLFATEEPDTLGERIADKVAEFGGSWKFIIIFCSILLFWIGLNVFVLTVKPFDPYPFILLNLLLSCVAALQAPVIMMSQNRQEAKDRKRAENDYITNLKAEIEIRNLTRKVDLLMEEYYNSSKQIKATLEELKNK